MRGTGRTVFIAGAGIAGLTLALALAKFGVGVTVLERSDRVQEYGAGLQISPNARRVLNQLGLDKSIADVSFEPAGIDVYPFGGSRPVATMQLGETVRQRFGLPYAVMHRADLLDALYRACRRFANIDIVLGVSGFDVAGHAKGISVLAELGPSGTREGRGFAFVGADGIRSHTRMALLDGPEPRWTGATAWRALVAPRALDGLIAMDRSSLFFGPGYHAVLYPLPHRGQVNIALFTTAGGKRAKNGAPAMPDLPRPSAAFARILAAANGQWGEWPVGTVTTRQWSKGAVGLVGDAAHAMVPFQAQGAAMAIEDAAVLAPLLVDEASAEAAFARYFALRHDRVARVARLSAANALAFHMPWPLSLPRNIGVRLQGSTGHLRRLAWLYGFDAIARAGLSAEADEAI